MPTQIQSLQYDPLLIPSYPPHIHQPTHISTYIIWISYIIPTSPPTYPHIHKYHLDIIPTYPHIYHFTTYPQTHYPSTLLLFQTALMDILKNLNVKLLLHTRPIYVYKYCYSLLILIDKRIFIGFYWIEVLSVTPNWLLPRTPFSSWTKPWFQIYPTLSSPPPCSIHTVHFRPSASNGCFKKECENGMLSI